MMGSDLRINARLARQLIQAAGPPDETNGEIYTFVEGLARSYGLAAEELILMD